MSDKRALRRAPLGSTATVRTETGQLECRIVNLSASGMALATDASQNLGRFVHVTTTLGLGTPQIDLDAMVVRRELKDDLVVWGVAFKDLPPKLVSMIETYVRRKGLDELKA